MFIENREKLLKKLKINSNINKFILAKSLYSLEKDASNLLLKSVAMTIVNRFFYEVEISETFPDIVKLLTSVNIFPAWKNLKNMDSIDTNSDYFKTCLKVAGDVLSLSNVESKKFDAIEFHKKEKCPFWAKNVSPKYIIDDFYFYDICM